MTRKAGPPNGYRAPTESKILSAQPGAPATGLRADEMIFLVGAFHSAEGVEKSPNFGQYFAAVWFLKLGSMMKALNMLRAFSKWAMAGVLLVGCAATGTLAVAGEGEAVAFKVYAAPYFVKNTFEPDAAESFIVLKSLDEFNAVFGVGIVGGGPKPAINAQTFETQMIVAAIKRGPLFDYDVTSVKSDMHALTVEYTAKSQALGSATFATPLIIAVPQAEYSEVKFSENNKEVKVIELAK